MRFRKFTLFAFVIACACLGPALRAASATPSPTAEPIVVSAGTTLILVSETTVSSATAQEGDVVIARLGADVRNGEETLLRSGSEVRGHVVSVKRSGKVKGKAELHIEFDTIEVKGRPHKIETSTVDEVAKSGKGHDAKIIGGLSGAGAIIGGIAGGGSGLLKGLLIGGAAGTGGVLATRGHEVVFEQGSQHTVTLEKSLTLRKLS